MELLLYCLILAVVLEVVLTAQPWWKTATFYQVYPRSFKDNNNDGTGDLNGITSKVDYLAEIGITAIWMNPINPSPMADNGYDVSDYRGIDSVFGTLADLQELIAALHAKNIKIVLDFVPNHSSDEHPWFKKSVNREGNYTNYYVWRNASLTENNTRTVPNNWGSVFQGTSWEWNEQREQYYLHQFQVKQPDLNVRDDNVRRELKEIIQFWLDQGIDGIRVDAVKYLAEDALFRDNPVINASLPASGFNIANTYTQNVDFTYELIKEWGHLVKAQMDLDGKDRIMLLEIYDTIQVVNSYSGGEELPFVLPFNDDLIFTMTSGVSALNVVSSVNSWLTSMPVGATANWQVGNHDRNRVATRAGTELIDSINMVLAMLPGFMVTYYGEELGMEDTYLNSNQSSDFRSPERTPLQWDETINSGFCSKCTPWIPLNPNYWRLNVAAQRNATKSHMKVFQNVMKLRSSNTFQSNTTQFQMNATDENTLAILRWADEGEKYLLVVNFGSVMIRPLTISFMNTFHLMNTTYFIINSSSINSGYNEGETILLSTGITLRPQAAVILEVHTGQPSSASAASSMVISFILLCMCLYLVNIFTY